MAGIQHLIYKNAKVCLTMRNMAPFQQLFYKLNQTDCSFCMTGLSVIIYQRCERCGFTAGNQNQTGGSVIYAALLYRLLTSRSRARFCHRTNVLQGVY